MRSIRIFFDVFSKIRIYIPVNYIEAFLETILLKKCFIVLWKFNLPIINNFIKEQRIFLVQSMFSHLLINVHQKPAAGSKLVLFSRLSVRSIYPLILRPGRASVNAIKPIFGHPVESNRRRNSFTRTFTFVNCRIPKREYYNIQSVFLHFTKL